MPGRTGPALTVSCTNPAEVPASRIHDDVLAGNTLHMYRIEYCPDEFGTQAQFSGTGHHIVHNFVPAPPLQDNHVIFTFYPPISSAIPILRDRSAKSCASIWSISSRSAPYPLQTAVHRPSRGATRIPASVRPAAPASLAGRHRSVPRQDGHGSP